MKRLFSTLLTASVISFTLSAQKIAPPNKPFATMNPEPGYMTINEFNAGIGLGNISTPYSKSFIGLTTIHSYQINHSFSAGGGTGVLFFNGGSMIPLLLDFRFNISVNKITPYAWADGGILLNLDDVMSETRTFINPGFGVRYALSRKLAFTGGAGFWLQNGTSRDSFVNIRAGLVFKPR